MRRKLKGIEKDQKVLTQVVRKSVLILNVTRLELAKNRCDINWLINGVRTLKEEVVNDSVTVMGELLESDNFVQQYFQLQKSPIGYVRRTNP